MAGLLAARVLADHFAKVTVIERDPAPTGIEAHRGVPQGHQFHLLLIGGATIVERLFPGIGAELEAGGALPFDFSADVHWHYDGVVKLRYPSAFGSLGATRPLLEETIRRRVAVYPNVVLRYGTSVSGFLTDPDKSRLTGVRLQSGDTSLAESIEADLIVDAGGRGSKARGWLEDLGFPRPPTTSVKFGLSYATQLYERGTTMKDWKSAAVHPHRPKETRGAFLGPIADNQWILTLQTYEVGKPPEDNAGLLEYLRALPRTEIYEAVKDCIPIGPIRAYNYSGQIRHHYARLPRLPEGFIAIGDAVCSFDPVFGQGMTVLANEAIILGEILRSRAAQPAETRLRGLPKAYFKKSDKLIDNAWLLASNEAFKYPTTEGDRPFGVGSILQWYTSHIFQLTATDRTVYDDFIRVMHMIAPPTVLFRPMTVAKVIAHAIAH
jgi:2-polyprenyl-6-methoxyphenol hydroxylase-like FAD-dependent oxidoreductase